MANENNFTKIHFKEIVEMAIVKNDRDVVYKQSIVFTLSAYINATDNAEDLRRLIL